MKSKVLFLLIIVLCGCRPEPAENISLFYNLDSLLTAQVVHLANQDLSLKKAAQIDGETEEIRLSKPDSTWWQKELNIFGQLDLNRKPVNAMIYQRQTADSLADGLAVTKYVAQEDAQVRYVTLFYQDHMQQNIRRIEGEIREENALYSSVRILSMEFDDIEGKMVLIGYEVNGGQKMILGDSVNFTISGRVTYP